MAMARRGAEGIPRVHRGPIQAASHDTAKAAADRKAVLLLEGPQQMTVGPITLGALIDSTLREVSPRTKTQAYHEKASALFIALWGRERAASTLSGRDVDV